MDRLVDSPRWIRARRDGETVADSRRTKLLYPEDHVIPRHVFPDDDVRLDLLPDEAITRHAEGLIEIDFGYPDEWLEEDEPLIGHARDPFKRIDCRRTSRHIRVSVGGQTVAETRRAVALFETGLPTRWYIPRDPPVTSATRPSRSNSDRVSIMTPPPRAARF